MKVAINVIAIRQCTPHQHGSRPPPTPPASCSMQHKRVVYSSNSFLVRAPTTKEPYQLLVAKVTDYMPAPPRQVMDSLRQANVLWPSKMGQQGMSWMAQTKLPDQCLRLFADPCCTSGPKRAVQGGCWEGTACSDLDTNNQQAAHWRQSGKGPCDRVGSVAAWLGTVRCNSCMCSDVPTISHCTSEVGPSM